jgi:hypothetical protein
MTAAMYDQIYGMRQRLSDELSRSASIVKYGCGVATEVGCPAVAQPRKQGSTPRYLSRCWSLSIRSGTILGAERHYSRRVRFKPSRGHQSPLPRSMEVKLERF